MMDSGAQRRVFFASFLTLVAAGMGFSIRSAILGDWGQQFGFTKTVLGQLNGFGLAGFGVTIILGGLVLDRVGYKPIMGLAFLLHAASAVTTLAAGPVYDAFKAESVETAQNYAYWCLLIGGFAFSFANGLCETVINPLTATLYPRQKTHYLNILHAGWPGGLVIGGLMAYCFVGRDAAITHWRWEIPMGLFLVPTLLYGLLMVREVFPVPETRAAGISFGEMLAQFASPMLLFLLLMHALVGYVELGTDSWMQDITKNIVGGNAALVFAYTSALMFVLRFFAGPIVERINPLGLLFVSGIIGCCGLLFLGTAQTLGMIVAAATVYALGKTFLWPTMLGVVGERFPRGGALAMCAMGGVGMLSAGLLGAPAIGYKYDYFAQEELKKESPQVYDEFKAAEPKTFLAFLPPVQGLDPTKVETIKDKRAAREKEVNAGKQPPAELALTQTESDVLKADLYGGQMALKWTAVVPATMAVGYLLLVLYFAATGGYKQLHVNEEPEGPAEY